MRTLTFTEKGFESLKKAILRNPTKTRDEVGLFLTRATALVKREIINNPWQIGSAGGGVPVATGNLRDTHETRSTPWERRIVATAPYAAFVHEGTKKMEARPWLDFAAEQSRTGVEELQNQMLDNIVNDLSS